MSCMHRVSRWMAAFCLAAVPLGAAAQLVIAGGVYDDPPALALRRHFVPVAGASVHLYRDGGDGLPSADDVRVAAAQTSVDGRYSFRVNRAGSYWVSVDSRSVAPGAWPEQTFGPAGALCAQPDGTSRTNRTEGACFGGQTFGSDDASSPAGSEHLAFVTLEDVVPPVDFAFSSNVVTTAADGERVQGSLRQFVSNANAISGPNRMRFVPIARAPEKRESSFGVPPRWWTIELATPLPALTDGGTVIDGAAYNFLIPSSLEHPHPGRFGEAPTIQAAAIQAPRTEKPDLELIAPGQTGVTCEAICSIRNLALHGALDGIVIRGGGSLEHLVVGAAPDAEPSARQGRTGITVEKGDLVALQLLVTAQSQAGVIVGAEARLDGGHLEVTRCGTAQAGAGIVLLSSGSSVRSSTIAANPGAAIIVGSLDGASPATGNTIDGCIISSSQAGVVLGPSSSRNVIARNDITWNRLGGVTVVPFAGAPPVQNRITANRFDENGARPIVLDLDVADPNALAAGGTRCTAIAAEANAGVRPPALTSVRMTTDDAAARVAIRGRACPGQVVELYQSFITAGVAEKQDAEVPLVRSDSTEGSESMTSQENETGLPSIGEFNFLGAATTDAAGAFAAEFTLPITTPDLNRESPNEEMNLWADEVLDFSDPLARAFSATATDSAGNTSEMSVRRRIDDSGRGGD